jgi:CspA family cold shock protein
VSESETGTVKNIVSGRGFAFIAADRGGKDVFVHYSEFQRAGLREPEVGDRYEFQIEMSRKNQPQATNLKAVV